MIDFLKTLEEPTEMRERIRKMRSAFVDRLHAHGASRDFLSCCSKTECSRTAD